MKELTFSKHSLERYAQRMQEYDNISVFLMSHTETVKERITKLIEYSDLIYTGRSVVDYNKEIVDVYLNRDGWIVIIDHKKNNVITLFNITLGLDDELDKMYLDKIQYKIGEVQKNRQEKLKSIEVSKDTYQKLIDENKILIQELRTQIKNLEKQTATYEEVVENLQFDMNRADDELRSIIAKVLGKKVF